VGAIAQHDIPATKTGTGELDITRAIAKTGEPSPFSRRGPSVGKAIKPDFVDFGGNLVFKGFSQVRQIGKDHGTSVISLSWKDALFGQAIGTSFAAPLVARKAALLEHKLKQDFGSAHPNLIRAVMACSSSIPKACSELLSKQDQLIPQVGYGEVDLDFCLGSEDDNVMLIYEGEIEIDKFSIFDIPIPEELRSTKGDKEFRIALSFDPPVRRRRADYLGVEMQFNLLRSISPEKIIEAYKKLGPDEEAPKLKASAKISVTPKKSKLFGRAKSALQRGTFVAKKMTAAHGDTYHLVVRCHRKWAPASIVKQRFAVAVSISANNSDLYNLVRQRVQLRARARTR
jgi:hypothetical protein